MQKSLAELKRACLQRIEDAYTRAEEVYGRKFTRVPVVFSNRLKTTAGKAWYDRNHRPIKISLSLPLLQLNEDTFVKRTPGHEVAHLIAVQLAGAQGTGHGRVWQQVMHTIGQPASARHDMTVARVRKVVYCNCQEHKVTVGMYNKMKTPGHRFVCKDCKTSIRLTK